VELRRCEDGTLTFLLYRFKSKRGLPKLIETPVIRQVISQDTFDETENYEGTFAIQDFIVVTLKTGVRKFLKSARRPEVGNTGKVTGI